MNVWDKMGWMEGRLSIKGLTGALTASLLCLAQPDLQAALPVLHACRSALGTALHLSTRF